jgi:hypothetical protein
VSRTSLRFSRRLVAVSATAALCVVVPVATASATSARGVRPHAFAAPTAITALQGTLFVANRSTSTVSALNAASGAYVKTFSHKTLGLTAPIALASSSGSSAGKAWHTLLVATAGGQNRVFAVATKAGKGVTLAGKIARGIPGCPHGASVAVTTNAAHDYVLVCSSGAIEVVAGSTGAIRFAIAPSVAGVTDATAVAVAGSIAFLTSSSPGAAHATAAYAKEGVVEVSLATKTRLASITNATCASCGFDDPDGIAVAAGGLWVADEANDQATQLTISPLAFVGTQTANLYGTGAVLASKSAVYLASVDGPGNSMVTMFTTSPVSYQWMMCNSNDAYKFDNPSSLALAAGTHGAVYLWVANPADNLLDQMDAVSGALLRTVS